jgi:hypothetical protein
LAACCRTSPYPSSSRSLLAKPHVGATHSAQPTMAAQQHGLRVHWQTQDPPACCCSLVKRPGQRPLQESRRTKHTRKCSRSCAAEMALQGSGESS